MALQGHTIVETDRVTWLTLNRLYLGRRRRRARSRSAWACRALKMTDRLRRERARHAHAPCYGWARRRRWPVKGKKKNAATPKAKLGEDLLKESYGAHTAPWAFFQNRTPAWLKQSNHTRQTKTPLGDKGGGPEKISAEIHRTQKTRRNGKSPLGGPQAFFFRLAATVHQGS